MTMAKASFSTCEYQVSHSRRLTGIVDHMFLIVFICLDKDHAYGRQGIIHIQGIILSIIGWLQQWCVGKCMLDIFKHASHEIIPDKRCILFKQPHETVCPFYIIADETT